MLTLTFVLVACAAFSLGMYLLGFYSTVRHTSQPPRRIEADVLPPLSLLKPIKGLEEELDLNLRSFFEQRYPGTLEIVVSSETADDPGVLIARAVAAEYPDVDVRFVLCDVEFGLNPKVANLTAAYRSARHELVLQSDANVRAQPGYLESIVRELLAEKATLLSSIVIGTGERSIGAALENLQLTALIGPSVCTALHVANVNCVIGKSMLMRRSDIDDIGGMESVKDILCEDFILGQRVQRSGRKVLLSTNILANVNRDIPIDRFFARHTRWLKMRAVIHVGSFFADLFANPVAWTFFAMLASGFADWTVALFLGVTAFKLAGDAFFIWRLRGHPMALHHLLLGPLKDIAMALIWPYCAVSRSIEWRGRKLRFGHESRLRHDTDGPLVVRLAKRILG
jgi:ceramide glucosyltransferase